jgi:hypothetical protein
MTKIDDRSDEAWCTTEDVRDLIHIPQKGSEKDFEGAIKRATNSVQSWHKKETGSTDLPDAANLDDLLVEATAWLAVSESTFTFGRNFSGQNNGGQADRTSTAEGKAHKKFNEWSDLRDVQSSEAATEGEATDTNARHGSLVDEF